jgi:hypothetical protein
MLVVGNVGEDLRVEEGEKKKGKGSGRSLQDREAMVACDWWRGGQQKIAALPLLSLSRDSTLSVFSFLPSSTLFYPPPSSIT